MGQLCYRGVASSLLVSRVVRASSLERNLLLRARFKISPSIVARQQQPQSSASLGCDEKNRKRHSARARVKLKNNVAVAHVRFSTRLPAHRFQRARCAQRAGVSRVLCLVQAKHPEKRGESKANMHNQLQFYTQIQIMINSGVPEKYASNPYLR